MRHYQIEGNPVSDLQAQTRASASDTLPPGLSDAYTGVSIETVNAAFALGLSLGIRLSGGAR